MSAPIPAQVVALDVRHVLEVRRRGSVEARRPPEVVDRERIDPVLREPQRELLVVRVQAADVRQDHDSGAARLGGPRSERREPVPVAPRSASPLGIERAARDRRDRRSAVEIEAHGPASCADRPSVVA